VAAIKLAFRYTIPNDTSYVFVVVPLKETQVCSVEICLVLILRTGSKYLE